MTHPGPHKEASTPSQNNGSSASWVPEATLNQAGIDTSLQFLEDALAREQNSKKGSKAAPAVNSKLLESAHAGIPAEVRLHTSSAFIVLLLLKGGNGSCFLLHSVSCAEYLLRAALTPGYGHVLLASLVRQLLF